MVMIHDLKMKDRKKQHTKTAEKCREKKKTRGKQNRILLFPLKPSLLEYAFYGGLGALTLLCSLLHVYCLNPLFALTSEGKPSVSCKRASALCGRAFINNNTKTNLFVYAFWILGFVNGF